MPSSSSPPSQPAHPTLTPQLCLSADSLRAFLRLSRAAIDDPISQHLNSLSHPSERAFDHASISAARPAGPARRSGQLPPSSCAGFVSHTLFPAYAARARVLEYCAGVAATAAAASSNGNDGGSGGGGSGSGNGARARWGGTIAGGALAIGAGVVGPEASGGGAPDRSQSQSQRPSLGPDGQAWSAARRPRVVDERLDPYSARDYSDESPSERLARIIQEERTVETIVRARSWAIVKDRCGAAIESWEEGMRRWESEMDKAQTKGIGREDSEKASSRGGLWS